jgi:hypothetical protein
VGVAITPRAHTASRKRGPVKNPQAGIFERRGVQTKQSVALAVRQLRGKSVNQSRRAPTPQAASGKKTQADTKKAKQNAVALAGLSRKNH